VTTRDQADVATCRIPLACIPVVSGNDRVRQLEDGDHGTPLPQENGRRSPIRPDIIGNRGVEDLHHAIGVENRSAVQPVAVLPLMVLLMIVMLPSERMPPPTSLDTLLLIVLRVMVVVVLKNE